MEHAHLLDDTQDTNAGAMSSSIRVASECSQAFEADLLDQGIALEAQFAQSWVIIRTAPE